MGSGDRYCYRNGVIKFEKSDASSLVRKKNKLFVLGEQRKKLYCCFRSKILKLCPIKCKCYRIIPFTLHNFLTKQKKTNSSIFNTKQTIKLPLFNQQTRYKNIIIKNQPSTHSYISPYFP